MIANPHPSTEGAEVEHQFPSAFFGLVAVIAALLSIVLFMPLMPVMPNLGLDPSWNLAANEATARGLQFGTDILYTVGPLSNVWTQAYHPETIHLAFVAGLLLTLGHAFLVYRLSLASHPAWFLVFVLAVAILMESRDTLFLFYPVLLVVVTFRMSLPFSHRDKIELTRGESVWLVLAGAGLGLLPIMKLSFLPLTLVAWIISSLLLLIARYRLTMVSMAVMPVLVMGVFSVLAGQELATLPNYFASNAPIVSGFTQAMSNRFFLLTPALYLLSSVLALYLVYRYLVVNGSKQVLLLLVVIAAFLFLSFKAGFVRQDIHALTASSSVVLCVVLLGSFRTIDYRMVGAGLVLALTTWFAVHGKFYSGSFEYYKSPAARVSASLQGYLSGAQLNLSWRDQYNARLTEIQRYYGIPQLEGSVDIYPYQISALIASQNHWSPRPVMQSFSAYTPELAKANAAHLSGPRAPDHILFELSSIDGRYPSMEDGASWPVLLAEYDVTGVTSHFLVLGRREAPMPEVELIQIASSKALIGEHVNVINSGEIIVAEIGVRSSSFGKLMNLFYKQSLLVLSVELSNGEVRRHRFVPGQAGAGFILSPYIDRLEGFASLWAPLGSEQQSLAVTGVRLDEIPASPSMWANEYSIELFKLNRAAISDNGGVTR